MNTSDSIVKLSDEALQSMMDNDGNVTPPTGQDVIPVRKRNEVKGQPTIVTCWQVPLAMSGDSESQNVKAMFADMFYEQRRKNLTRWQDGELVNPAVILDWEAMAEDYFADGRRDREGLSQAEVASWIEDDLYPVILASAKVNLAGKMKDQQITQLAVSVREGMLLCASRSGSKRVGKNESKHVTLQLLKDMEGRLQKYIEKGLIVSCDESKAILARIEYHRVGLTKAMAEVTAADF